MGMLGAEKASIDGTKIKAYASVKQSKNEKSLEKEIPLILFENALIKFVKKYRLFSSRIR